MLEKIFETRKLEEILESLDTLNDMITSLKLEKEELEIKVIELLKHESVKPKKYTHGDYSITVTTKNIYTLDKEYFNELKDDPAYSAMLKDVVKTKVSYEVIPSQFEDNFSTYTNVLCNLVTTKPAKPHIKLSKLEA